MKRMIRAVTVAAALALSGTAFAASAPALKSGDTSLVDKVADLDVDVYVGEGDYDEGYYDDGPRTAGVYVERRGGYRRCRAWRRECTFRFPNRGWRFQRCMARHGC
jgi:hypothetical protein